MASKGARIGMGAASGAATGAAIGSAFTPVGTAIGGVLGAVGGGLAGLLSASDEAKERRKAEAAMRQQAEEAAQRDWEQRVAAISGLSSNPLYMAMSYEPYDPKKTDEEIKRQMDARYPEQGIDYGALFGNIGTAAGAVGKNMQADARFEHLQDMQKIGEYEAAARGGGPGPCPAWC